MTKVPLSELKPAPYNPRKIEGRQLERLKKSLEQDPAFLEARPLIVNKRSGNVVGGNMRLKAAQELGWTEIPVHYVDLDEKEEKRWNLKDNALYGIWEKKMLGDLLQQMTAMEIDETGLDQATIDDALKKALEALKQNDPEEVPEPPITPTSCLGDVYQLGDHRVMCGDATKLEDVEKLMAGEKADMIFTDPPYNVDYEGKTKDSLKIQNDAFTDNDSFRVFLLDAFTALNAVSNEGAGIYVCHADSEGLNFRMGFEGAGFELKQCIIWNKNSMVMGRQDYQWKHEPILYGWKKGTHKWYGDRKQVTVWDIDRPSRSSEHPTMKPLPLITMALVNSSASGDVVLDTFGGSGSTLIACEQTKRKCRMMELDPRYVDVIVKRWETLTGLKAVKVL
jgi:DNA modification methylase